MADTIQIEKGIPIPRQRGGVGAEPAYKYPWAEMGIGDSFVIGKKISNASTAANAAAKSLGGGRKFTTRKIDATTTRIWRIA